METTTSILTQEDCQKALEQHLKTKNFNFITYETKPLSESVEGMLGEHYIITIKYKRDSKEETVKFFMKIINPEAKVAFQMAMSINAYEKEIFLYKDIIEECKKLKINTDYAPGFYHTKEYLIILENLCEINYKTIPKRTMFDLAHGKAAMKVLAEFHASSIILEQIKKKTNKDYCIFNEHKGILEEKMLSGGDVSATAWYNETFLGVMEIINKLPENTISNKQFKEKLEQIFANLDHMVTAKKVELNCIIHGDLWTNNFLFKYGENNLPIHTKLIDYQLLSYNHPANDVMLVILTDMRKEIRDKHLKTFQDVYYEHLEGCLKQHGFKIDDLMTKRSFLEKCESLRIDMGLHAVGDHTITFTFNDLDSDFVKNDESMKNFLIGGRKQAIIDSFDTNEQFRELMTEDLLDLKKAIFKID